MGELPKFGSWQANFTLHQNEILLVAVCCAASALPQNNKSEPQVLLPWDRLARDNITVTAQTGSGAFRTEKKYFSKTLDVLLSPIGSNSNPATVELFIVCGAMGSSRSLGVLAPRRPSGAGRFTFVCDQEQIGYRGDEITGWLVRAVRDGRVAGFAASSGPCEEIAKNPALLSDMLAQEWQRK
jgi:hypothetical protein